MKRPEEIKVSVLTPAYNAAKYLPELLESLAAQTHPNLEHVVIDDGSRDDTRAILAASPRVTLVSRENRGQYATQNELLDLATGDVLGIICADDLVATPDSLAAVARAFAQDPDLDVVVGVTPRLVDRARPYLAYPDPPGWLAVRALRHCNGIQHCSVFARRELFEQQGLRFDGSYRMRGDWDWLQRLFKVARKVRWIPDEIGIWRQHPAQTSRVAEDRGREETARLLAANGGSAFLHRLIGATFDVLGKVAHARAIVGTYGWGALRDRSLLDWDLEPNEKRRVLVLADYYFPGYKAGGPAVSIGRILGHLGEEEEAFLFTRNHDLGETAPYPDQPTGQWIAGEHATLYYAPEQEISVAGVQRAIEDVRPHLVYANSWFSPLTRAALKLRARGKLGGALLVIAPRGEFSPGALKIKGAKKRIYNALARLQGRHRGLVWHVSTELERSELAAVYGETANSIVQEPDPPDARELAPVERTPKRPGELRLAFLSRISRKKNLLGAIELASRLKGDVTFRILGPVEDTDYWAECERAIAAAPPGIRFEVVGAVPPNEVRTELARSHLLLFPTFGENFGHVIPEALSAGVPVLTSDQTPWPQLEPAGAGWALPLEPASEWVRRLQAWVDADDATHAAASRAALDVFRELVRQAKASASQGSVFDRAWALSRTVAYLRR